MKDLFSKFFGLFFIVSCKRFSVLASEQLDRSLSWHEKVTVWLHGFHCTFCRRFFKQIKSIDSIANCSKIHDHIPDKKMPELCRQKIAEKLKEETRRS